MASVSLQKFNQIIVTASSPSLVSQLGPFLKVLLLIQNPFYFSSAEAISQFSAALEYFMLGSILSLNDIFYYGWILNNEICCQTLSGIMFFSNDKMSLEIALSLHSFKWGFSYRVFQGFWTKE